MPAEIDMREFAREQGIRFTRIFPAWGRRVPIPDYDPKVHGSDPDRYLMSELEAATVLAEIEAHKGGPYPFDG